MSEHDPNVRLIGPGSSARDQNLRCHVIATMTSLELGCLPQHGIGRTLDVLMAAYLNLAVKHGLDVGELRQPLECFLENLEHAVRTAQLVHAKAANSPDRAS